MLAKALDWIASKSKPELPFAPHEEPDPRKRTLAVNGLITEMAVEPPLRKPLLDSLAALADFLASAKAPAVYVDSSCITAYLDSADRREYASVKLEWTQAWSTWCQGLNGKPAALRRDFANRLGIRAHSFLDRMAKVDFSRLSKTTHRATRGSESLGSEVEETVQGVDSMPADCTLDSVQVFATLGLRDYRLNLEWWLDFDVSLEEIALYRPTDHLKQARGDALKVVRAKVKEALENAGLEGCPVYLGAAS